MPEVVDGLSEAEEWLDELVTETDEEAGAGWRSVTWMTALAVLVQGYHPYAEDGGLYVAGIRRLLAATLYPHATEFVVEHLRFSIFAPVVAGVVRVSGLGVEVGLEAVLLLLYVGSFWVTLYAGWMLAGYFSLTRRGRLGAIGLLAAWMTLPIAGTSLMLMDPYVTARSISTPCALLALVGLLEFVEGGRRRGALLCVGALSLAAAMHPLMAAYAAGCVLVLACLMSGRRAVRVYGTAGLIAAAILLATVVQAKAPAESAEYVTVAVTRYYWFIAKWQWYEQVGVVAPLLILAVAWGKSRNAWRGPDGRQALLAMTVLVGSTALAIALLFAREGAHTHLVARLQPLRVFQIVYVVMIILLGAWLGEIVLPRRRFGWFLVPATMSAVMCLVALQTFPASRHIEWPEFLPWSAPINPWIQAFVWARENTPKDALFAMDAHYITRDGEDAQCFRAIAERSSLPDYSKDGGEASITPSLTQAWVQGEAAQDGLNEESDAARKLKLGPLGVTWIILDKAAKTTLRCDYQNMSVKVCRLR